MKIFYKYIKLLCLILVISGGISELIPSLSNQLYAKNKKIKSRKKKTPRRFKKKKKVKKTISKKVKSLPKQTIAPKAKPLPQQPIAPARLITEKTKQTTPFVPAKIVEGPTPPPTPHQLPKRPYREPREKVYQQTVSYGFMPKYLQNRLRLIMLLDPTGSDIRRQPIILLRGMTGHLTGLGAVAINLVDGLAQLTSPILTSAHILAKVLEKIISAQWYFLRKSDHKEMIIEAMLENCKRNCQDIKTIMSCINYSIPETIKDDTDTVKNHFILLQLIYSLDNKHMRAFVNKETHMILLVPIVTISTQYMFRYHTPQEEILTKLGFESKAFTELALLPLTPSKPSLTSEFNEKLYAIFDQQLTQEGAINLVPKNPEVVGRKLPDLFLDNEKSDTYYNIYAIGHGGDFEGKKLTINLDLDNFTKLLQALNTKIPTNLFFYNSCYGGSQKVLTEPYEKIPGKTLNYTLVSGASSNAPSALNPSDKWYNIGNRICTPLTVDFESFFESLETGKPITESLNAIVENTINAGYSFSTPIVRFPGTETFTTQWKKGKKDTYTKTSLDSVMSVGYVNQLQKIASGKNIDVTNKKLLVLQNIDTVIPQIKIGANDKLHIIRVPHEKKPTFNYFGSDTKNLKDQGLSDEEIQNLQNLNHPTTYLKHVSTDKITTLIKAIAPHQGTVLDDDQTWYIEQLDLTNPTDEDKKIPKLKNLKIVLEKRDLDYPKIKLWFSPRPNYYGYIEYRLTQNGSFIEGNSDLYGSFLSDPKDKAAVMYYRLVARDLERKAKL